MNRKNIKKVRDVIAGLPRKRFDMSALFLKDREEAWDSRLTPEQMTHGCGTAACIAGWTLAILRPRTKNLDSIDAAELLGISGPGDALFMPLGFSTGRYTQAHAVRVLDHLLATGEVDWESTRRAKRAVAK